MKDKWREPCPSAMYDVVIIGGGIIGSSTAYNLKRLDADLGVAVIEPDPTYARASSTLSLANIRIQYGLRGNIEISLYGFEVLEKFSEEMAVSGSRPDITFRREGNLFLIEEGRRGDAERAMDLQRSLGCEVKWLTPEMIKKRFPLYEPTGFAGATFGPQDGYLDAYSLLMGYKKKALSLGADYIHNKVEGIAVDSGRAAGVALASGENVPAGCVVNCAGAWCSQIARMAGIELPVQPVKRQVFVLDTAVKPEQPLPLTILPSGLYFRTETGGLILAGKSMSEDSVGFDFTWEQKRFTEILWPELVEFVPAFESLRLVRGWAGLYEVNTFDANAILGEWPDLKGFYCANGFSGHGLQQAPAAGRYIAELITETAPSLDLSIFSPKRLLENRPIVESAIV
ncbi:NAD(P)/FAD-dependent oxidoreductase [candidate division KSB1 bacterium]